MENKLLIISSIALGILVLSIGSFIIYLYSENIFYLANLSVKSSCGEITDEELADIGFSVVGRYNASNDEIIIYNLSNKTLKHEQCHKVQSLNNRLYSCDHKILKLTNEIECYLSERYSNSFYESIYGDIEGINSDN